MQFFNLDRTDIVNSLRGLVLVQMRTAVVVILTYVYMRRLVCVRIFSWISSIKLGQRHQVCTYTVLLTAYPSDILLRDFWKFWNFRALSEKVVVVIGSVYLIPHFSTFRSSLFFFSYYVPSSSSRIWCSNMHQYAIYIGVSSSSSG